MKERISIAEVMGKVQASIPALVEHMFLDGAWIWYCGPSLAGKENEPVRQHLKDIGFRFCFKGHPMKNNDGQATNVIGTWGHSCEKPTSTRRRPSTAARQNNTAESAAAPVREPSPAELIALL